MSAYRKSYKTYKYMVLPDMDPNGGEETEEPDEDRAKDPSENLLVMRPEKGSPSKPSPADICFKRSTLTVRRKECDYIYEEIPQESLKEKFISKAKAKTQCSRERAKKHLLLRLPILEWLLKYNFKTDFTGDLISGFTVAVMHIPQGMAYAMLAGLDPIYGIYMAFYPVLTYAIFGTSRHCSFGTFAVVCIMVSKVVTELSTPLDEMDDASLLSESANATEEQLYKPIQVASIVSFIVALWLLIFAIFQLGMLSVFLSDMLVSGFTTGAACHVFSSQVKHIFGISIATYSGPFKLIKTWRDIILSLPNTNPATIIISAISLVVLIINNEVFKPRLKKYTKIPLPIELFVVIISTVASKYANFNTVHKVIVVGDIPTGLPVPEPPAFDLLGKVVIDSLIIAIVAYTISFSMSKIFAKKHDYTVNATQELYAQSLSNFVGSIFSCAPVCASLSRSLIQEDVGGNTQMASFVSCTLLAMVLLYIGPFFETLPNSVLGCIIMVALKGMFMQFKDLIKIFKASKLDASLWVITFLSVVVINIDYGLFIGIAMSILILLLRNQTPNVDLLGRVPDTEIYLDMQRYSSVKEVPGIKVCRISGNLHFANAESTKTLIMSVSELDPREICKSRKKEEKQKQKRSKESGMDDVKLEVVISDGSCAEMNKRRMSANSSYSQEIYEDGTNISKKGEDDGSPKRQLSDQVGTEIIFPEELYRERSPTKSIKSGKSSSVITIPEIKWLVLELSGVCGIDASAAKALVQLNKDYEEAGIKLVLAGIAERLIELMRHTGSIEAFSEECLFHSTHDAVTSILSPSHSESSLKTPTKY